MSELKNKLIRLAYQKPEFRQPIMGILKEAYDDDPTFEDFKKSIPAVYAKLKGTLHSLFRGRSSLKASAKRGFIELGGEIDYQETRVELSISWDDRRKEPEIEVQVRAAEEGDDLDYKTSIDFYGDPEFDAQVIYNKIKRIVENPYWSA